MKHPTIEGMVVHTIKCENNTWRRSERIAHSTDPVTHEQVKAHMELGFDKGYIFVTAKRGPLGGWHDMRYWRLPFNEEGEKWNQRRGYSMYLGFVYGGNHD